MPHPAAHATIHTLPLRSTTLKHEYVESLQSPSVGFFYPRTHHLSPAARAPISAQLAPKSATVPSPPLFHPPLPHDTIASKTRGVTYEVDIARRPSTAVAAERAAVLLLSIAIAIATFVRTGGTLAQRCARGVLKSHWEIPANSEPHIWTRGRIVAQTGNQTDGHIPLLRRES